MEREYLVKVKVSTETDMAIFEEPVTAESPDEAKQIAERYVRDMIDTEAIEATLINTEEELEDVRNKSFGLKAFASAFSDDDREVPYVFDLLYDIKSEAHLYKAIREGGCECPIADIEHTALEHGYSMVYLARKYKTEEEDENFFS